MVVNYFQFFKIRPHYLTSSMLKIVFSNILLLVSFKSFRLEAAIIPIILMKVKDILMETLMNILVYYNFSKNKLSLGAAL